MASVCFIDTSVLLNILDVPQRNAERAAVIDEYRRRKSQAQIILPISTVIETGNHISQVADGWARRKCAERFVEMLNLIIDGKASFVMHELGWDADFLRALVAGGSTRTAFVEHLTGVTIGCGDLSILVERDRYLARVAKGTTATIWTLDAGLRAYG
jgi:hypothetical protein